MNETARLATMSELAKGAYVYVQPDRGWCINNAGLLTGSQQSLLIDTVATERRSRALAQAVTQIVPAGPDYVVNTHSHGDHTFGNHWFTPRALIISQHECKQEQITAGTGLCDLWPQVDWGYTPVVSARLTYETGPVHLDLGELEAVLIHPRARAHTGGDTVVWQPQEAILFTGDIAWSATTPFCLMGSITGSLEAIAELRLLQPRIVVPGHGPVGGPEILDQTEAYLSWVLDVARAGVRAGLDPLQQASRTDLSQFAELSEPERLVGNLHRAYAELTQQPLDVEGLTLAFAQMVQWNGGLPACFA